jgi:hypothetical protein
MTTTVATPTRTRPSAVTATDRTPYAHRPCRSTQRIDR